MINKKSLIALAVAVGILAPAEIMAHATFPKKDSYFTPDGRSYLEGTSSELALNLAHACGADTGTIITTLAFPNGGDGPDEVYDLKLRFNANNANLELAEDPVPSSLTLADALTGDALSGIKPRVDGDWHEIVPKPQGRRSSTASTGTSGGSRIISTSASISIPVLQSSIQRVA